MSQVSTEIIIFAPDDAVWQVISDFAAASKYLSGVVDCVVKSEGVGALRTLTSTDGGTVVERLEMLDEANQRLSYVLLTETPFRDCFTTISVRDLGQSRAELEWSTTFEVDGLPMNEAVELMEGALEANCAALKQFMEC